MYIIYKSLYDLSYSKEHEYIYMYVYMYTYIHFTTKSNLY